MIRFFDFFLSFWGLILLFPFFIIISFLIKIDSCGPVFYKQKRVGLLNSDFYVWKFRTMYINSDKNGLLTVGGKDPRITNVGYYLRKFKVDELPQLINVLTGSMSLVGPRPEVRKYVDYYSGEQLKVLDVKPGITDWASIMYSNENLLLEKSIDPENDYIKLILPDKINYNLIFINNRTLFEYLKILIFTLRKIFIYSDK
jgi:lipopolysaccharide/colanic/teichoic acid biosynthesis glycosyltransferase